MYGLDLEICVDGKPLELSMNLPMFDYQRVHWIQSWVDEHLPFCEHVDRCGKTQTFTDKLPKGTPWNFMHVINPRLSQNPWLNR